MRRRIEGAYLMLAVVLCSCFSAIAFTTVRFIEDQLVNHRLEVAADTLINDHLQGLDHKVPGYPVVLHGAQLTPLLRSLSAGMHEIDIDDRSLHVLVRDRETERYVVMDDESQFERIERYVFASLAGAFVLCLGLAILLGFTTASRVISPVIRLSDAVRDQTLGPDSPQLQADDELGVLARAFVERSQQMQGFLLREQLFTGDVSHELRTPLAVILGAAELLRARLEDRPDLREVAERIRRTAADTAERVSALLLLSRSPETIDAPLVDVVPLIEHEVERCRPLVRRKPVDLFVTARQPQVWVRARPELVSIAIGNLIRNACQFTDRGQVQVTVEPYQVTVQDTGSGIPEDVRTRIFERYVRAAPPSVAGTGLGLAIVQRVAEHLGWTVELREAPGGGSQFVVHVQPSSLTGP